MTTATLDHATVDFAFGASVAPCRVRQNLALAQRIRDRLDLLSDLPEGWDREQAKPVDRDALRLAWTVAEQFLRAGLPEPELFPVPDGGVQLEWQAGPIELELEIEPGGRAVVFVCDDEQSHQQIDGELPHDESRFGLALARLNAHA